MYSMISYGSAVGARAGQDVCIVYYVQDLKDGEIGIPAAAAWLKARIEVIKTVENCMIDFACLVAGWI